MECDVASARALATRVRMAMRTASVAVSLGCATRRPGEKLKDMWHRADSAMYRYKRAQQRHMKTPRQGGHYPS